MTDAGRPHPFEGIDRYRYFCEWHDRWVEGEDHRYCEERGLVSRWERESSPTYATDDVAKAKGDPLIPGSAE